MFLCCTANLVTTKVMPQETSKIDSNINLNLKKYFKYLFCFLGDVQEGTTCFENHRWTQWLFMYCKISNCGSYRQRISYIILCKDSEDTVKVYNDNPERFEVNGNA